MPDRDSTLDARLRDVPLPSSLPARLAAAAVFDDTSLDRIVNDVRLPAGLMDRLRTSRTATGGGTRRWSTIELGASDVAGPRERGGGTAGRRLTRLAATIGREGLAVGCAIACGWLFFTAGAGLSSWLAGAPRGGQPRLGPAVATRATEPEAPREPLPGEAAAATSVAAQAPAVVASPPSPVVADDTPAERARDRSVASAPLPTAPPQVRGAAVGLPALPGGRTGAAPVIPLAPARSRFVPRVRGFDLGFEMAHGESPFVDPASAELSTDRPPLVLATDSFDRLRHTVRRPEWRTLKTEHVLASLDDGRIDLPAAQSPPANDLRLSLHGVRSLRTVRAAPTILVEVAVVAGARASGPARSAVVVLDRCEGSSRPVWTAVCRALAAAGRAMAAEDRLSVIVAGPLPRLAVRSGDAAAIRQVATELESLSPTDVSDLDAAMSLATVEAAAMGSRIVVACHAETADRARREAAEAVVAWRHGQAAGDGDGLDADRAAAPAFVLIDPLPAAPAGPASLGRTPSDAVSIRRALMRNLFGDSADVARTVELAVTFDPRHVAAYRLVGHRQSAVDSLAHTPVTAIDLAAGETARVVYEIVPRGPLVDGMVTATATWQAVATGSTRRTRGTLAAGDRDLHAALPSPHGCGLLLATALGEAASGSPHADPRGVSKALAIANRCRDRGDLPAAAVAVAGSLERLATEARRSP